MKSYIYKVPRKCLPHRKCLINANYFSFYFLFALTSCGENITLHKILVTILVFWIDLYESPT